MKIIINKIIFSFFVVFTFYFSVYGQSDIVKIEHTFYTSYFSVSEHIPIVLNYTLTKDMIQCNEHFKRTNKFIPDPAHSDITNLAKDYRHSGFDKGHNMSAGDNRCSMTGMKECFYFTNMTPQPHFFNAGTWEDVEKLERNEVAIYDSLIITVGSIGNSLTIGPDKVVVPEYMWKVIYIPSINSYKCYYFPNSYKAVKPYAQYEVSLSRIEKEANITFNRGIVEFKTK